MKNHANHIAAMPGVLLIDGDKPGFFTEYELVKELKDNTGVSRKDTRRKIVTIRAVDRILDRLCGTVM